MAASFLMLKGSLEAEIVYVDIEPDIILFSDNDQYLDMDDNGTDDFHFRMRTGFRDVLVGYYSSSTVYSELWSYMSMRAGAMNGNGMKFESVSITSDGNYYYFYAAAALEYGEPINPVGGFHTDDDMMRVAFKQRLVTATSHIPIGMWHYTGIIEPWDYDQLLGADRYKGVWFKDADDCRHYGWIRCAVADSGRQYILKDYAFETECNYPLNAGDTSGGFIASIQNDIPDVNIYENSGLIYINLTQHTENDHVHIADVSGKEIYTSSLHNLQTTIELPQAGVYIVSVNLDGKIYTKKIVTML
jgi:hypothetical protein